jgi:hypothetical protein
MDKVVRKILLSTYWSTAGWKDNPKVSREDYQCAKSKGVMFDAIHISHDEMMDWLLRAYQQANKQKVTNAFLGSLSARRLELRSALGSYALARTFPQHTFLPVDNTHVPVCRLCGEMDDSQAAQDLNILNFERIKWGGVRHTHPLYAAFDLSQLAGTEVPEPVESGYDIFNRILEVILSCGADDRPGQLEKKLSGVFSSSKDERIGSSHQKKGIFHVPSQYPGVHLDARGAEFSSIDSQNGQLTKLSTVV